MSKTDQLLKSIDAATLRAVKATIALLKKCGIDQFAIAQRLGLKNGQISQWNTGRRPFSTKNALVLHRLTLEATAHRILLIDEVIALKNVIDLWKETVELRKELVGAIQHDIGSQLAIIEKKPDPDNSDKQQQESLIANARRIAEVFEQNIIFSYLWAAVSAQWDEASRRCHQEHISNTTASTVDNNYLSVI